MNARLKPGSTYSIQVLHLTDKSESMYSQDAKSGAAARYHTQACERARELPHQWAECLLLPKPGYPMCANGTKHWGEEPSCTYIAGVCLHPNRRLQEEINRTKISETKVPVFHRVCFHYEIIIFYYKEL